ncbi:MAG: hypothetical protein MR765_07140 [Tenericutes bacterium]|nr:hypothetical protein [Mycoplasmatota bacterium]
MKEENIKYLSNVIDENKLSHAFLVESNNYEDVMNSVFKLFLEKKMIFNIDDIENNISVRILRPIDNLIDKDQILNLQEFLSTMSFDGYYKLFFILNAGLMNEQSVNKLLKVLEEPNEKVVGFLIGDNSNELLPTLISRCQVLKNDIDASNVEVDEDIFNNLCKFKNFNFEDYIKFKVVVSKLDKVVINNLFLKYLAYLDNENDIFYLKVNAFLNNIRYNVNIDLALDKLYFESLE